LFHGRLPVCTAGALLIGLSVFSAPTVAVEVSDHWDINGAVRLRVDHDDTRGIHEFGVDTVMLGAKYNSDTWIGAARYRFYGKDYPFQYTRRFGEVNFAEYAWVGYRIDPKRHVEVGLNQVPFGVQSLFGDTFYESLGNPSALEDLFEVGGKYVQQLDGWNLQTGYYARPAWSGQGTSRGSTYSIVITPADPWVAGGTRNVERNMFAGRVARDLDVGGWNGEAGVSLLTSTLHNLDTRRDGRRLVYGLHYAGNSGPWGAKLQYARQLMTPQNPDGSQVVTVGGYDGTFNLASRGNLYSINGSYDVPGSYLGGWVKDIKLYSNYSLYQKSNPQFRNTQRWITGASFSLKFLSIYVEWLEGRNDPYLGGSDYAQSLAAGGIDRWRGQLYMNIGYYF
jgi:hypothetical protein